jgi:MFS family permease
VPVVSEALNVAPLSMKSVLASYTLSLAVFIPISGWMADRFGTRQSAQEYRLRVGLSV